MSACYLEVAVVVLGLVLLAGEAFVCRKNQRLIGYGALAGLLVVFLCLFAVKPDAGNTEFYAADKLALFYKGLALVCTGIVLILSFEYRPVLEKFSARAGGGPATGEFFCLPVFICAGLMWMASAIDLTTIFASLELVTISFYVMVAYMRRNVGSLEAGVKYLILGALSTGFLVYGFTWLYGVTGHTSLAGIRDALTGGVTDRAPALFAFALILVALGFKVAAVPFHLWVPDVYQGAPTPVTAYLSVGSKAAGFIVAGRLLEPFLAAEALRGQCTALLLAMAAATLILGNMAAIPQSNFKRLMAYSSIAHAGFLLLALAGGSTLTGLPASHIVAFYLAAYLCMTLLCFAVLVIMNRISGGDDLRTFDGLQQRSPFLAFALVIGVSSLAGVPLTAGFPGKFFVFLSAAQAGHWLLVGIAIAGAAAGFYYYLKVVRHVFWQPASDTAAITFCPLTRLTMIVLIAATIVFGLYPQPVFNLLR